MVCQRKSTARIHYPIRTFSAVLLFLVLDIPPKSVSLRITHDRRKAYARGLLHISPFEASWTIAGACACGIRTTDIPLQNNDGLYPRPQRWTSGCSLSCGRALREDKEVIMPIRISCHDKLLNSVQLIESTGINTPPANNPKACYTDRKTQLRILCGSV
jgi:hypothetical protein